MKPLAVSVCLLLCSCGDSGSAKFWESETFRALPVPTQIAVVFFWPALALGVAACIRAGK